MTEDAAFLTLPLAPEGELGPQFDVISGVFQKLPDVLKETLGIILGAEIDVSEPKMASFSQEELASAIDPAAVCLVHTTFSKGIEGASFIIAKNDTARALVEIILGAPVEGEDEGLSADSMDAFLELVNQICGKVNLSFSEVVGSTVSTGTFTAFDKESQELSVLLPDGASFCVELGVSAADSADVASTATEAVADEQATVAKSAKLDGAVFFLYSASAVEQLTAASEASAGPSIDDIIAEAQAEESEVKAPGLASEPSEVAAEADLSAIASAEAEMDERLKVIMDMEMPVHVRFGETQMYIRDLLQLGAGSIIELNKTVDTPVDLVVNEDLVIAKGEVVVVESNFAIRITEVKSKAYRIKGLG